LFSGSIRLPRAVLVMLISLELRCIPNTEVEEQEKTDTGDSNAKGDLEKPENSTLCLAELLDGR